MIKQSIDNRGRLGRPDPAFGDQTIRLRLNRSGDRHLNQALHTVVLTRFEPTRRSALTSAAATP